MMLTDATHWLIKEGIAKEDRVVHVEQSQLYADELEDYDKPFKYLELESADHYLTMGSNRLRFFEELNAFLATYLQ